eukprot:7390874-Prymnesium_polylepis.1
MGKALDWDAAATRLGDHVSAKCGRWLIGVEGVGQARARPHTQRRDKMASPPPHRARPPRGERTRARAVHASHARKAVHTNHARAVRATRSSRRPPPRQPAARAARAAATAMAHAQLSAPLQPAPDAAVHACGGRALQTPGAMQDPEMEFAAMYPHYFDGENLVGARRRPVKLADHSRLVYAPHVYGPGVRSLPYMETDDFPDNTEQARAAPPRNAAPQRRAAAPCRAATPPRCNARRVSP